ncbi:hypothetical protein WJX72_005657 [[Myrmecia] bisecta]|uniref:AP2/ERF domain-containing protein n=1 Tax=[Myrmecia] bisecta TaxID=41462 RepID=A0AAW1QBX1_9CHLO
MVGDTQLAAEPQAEARLTYKGVRPSGKKWRARISVENIDGKRVELGTFKTQEEAAHVRDKAIYKLGLKDELQVGLTQHEMRELDATPWEQLKASWAEQARIFSKGFSAYRGGAPVDAQAEIETSVAPMGSAAAEGGNATVSEPTAAPAPLDAAKQVPAAPGLAGWQPDWSHLTDDPATCTDSSGSWCTASDSDSELEAGSDYDDGTYTAACDPLLGFKAAGMGPNGAPEDVWEGVSPRTRSQIEGVLSDPHFWEKQRACREPNIHLFAPCPFEGASASDPDYAPPQEPAPEAENVQASGGLDLPALAKQPEEPADEGAAGGGVVNPYEGALRHLTPNLLTPGGWAVGEELPKGLSAADFAALDKVERTPFSAADMRDLRKMAAYTSPPRSPAYSDLDDDLPYGSASGRALGDGAAALQELLNDLSRALGPPGSGGSSGGLAGFGPAGGSAGSGGFDGPAGSASGGFSEMAPSCSSGLALADAQLSTLEEQAARTAGAADNQRAAQEHAQWRRNYLDKLARDMVGRKNQDAGIWRALSEVRAKWEAQGPLQGVRFNNDCVFVHEPVADDFDLPTFLSSLPAGVHMYINGKYCGAT